MVVSVGVLGAGSVPVVVGAVAGLVVGDVVAGSVGVVVAGSVGVVVGVAVGVVVGAGVEPTEVGPTEPGPQTSVRLVELELDVELDPEPVPSPPVTCNEQFEVPSGLRDALDGDVGVSVTITLRCVVIGDVATVGGVTAGTEIAGITGELAGTPGPTPGAGTTLAVAFFSPEASTDARAGTAFSVAIAMSAATRAASTTKARRPRDACG